MTAGLGNCKEERKEKKGNASTFHHERSSTVMTHYTKDLFDMSTPAAGSGPSPVAKKFINNPADVVQEQLEV